MTRLNMFEILKEKYNINDEFSRILQLFNSDLVKGTWKNYTIEQMSAVTFPKWLGRGTCINYQDMRKELGIDNVIKAYFQPSDVEIILCLEYIVNIIALFEKIKNTNYEYKVLSLYSMLVKNIDILLDYMHYQKYNIKDEEKIILIPKDPAAMTVAEQSSEDTALAILMYNHASLKGDLECKKEILRKIAKEYENLLKDGINGFSEYFDKARHMLNEFDIRHNNIDKGKSQHKLILKMSAKKIEEWLDELYQLLLFCVLIKDNVKRKKEIEEFLKILNKKD